jgi:hypothetical protein
MGDSFVPPGPWVGLAWLAQTGRGWTSSFSADPGTHTGPGASEGRIATSCLAFSAAGDSLASRCGMALREPGPGPRCGARAGRTGPRARLWLTQCWICGRGKSSSCPADSPPPSLHLPRGQEPFYTARLLCCCAERKGKDLCIPFISPDAAPHGIPACASVCAHVGVCMHECVHA